MNKATFLPCAWLLTVVSMVTHECSQLVSLSAVYWFRWYVWVRMILGTVQLCGVQVQSHSAQAHSQDTSASFPDLSFASLQSYYSVAICPSLVYFSCALEAESHA